MPAPARLIGPDGRLTPCAVRVLQAFSGVRNDLLLSARIRPAQANWLRAPWYTYHHGGAITIGRTIWFNRKWFDASGHGDGSILSTWIWLQHLAHEVGHLPQAERFGLSLWGRSLYVVAFTGQYAQRALLLRRDVHDGAPLEREADRGRWVLRWVIGNAPLTHPLVMAVHHGYAQRVEQWLAEHHRSIAEAQNRYDDPLGR